MLAQRTNELVRLDLVQADVQAVRVLGAYPFASRPRGHRVDVDGNPKLQAYCAADALGVAAMLNRAVTIRSRDPQNGVETRVEVRGDEVTWEPSEAVVSIPSDQACDGQQSGDCDCPAINFYTSPANARAHEQVQGLKLELLTVPQAHQLGSVIFGDLLKPDERRGPANRFAAGGDPHDGDPAGLARPGSVAARRLWNRLFEPGAELPPSRMPGARRL